MKKQRPISLLLLASQLLLTTSCGTNSTVGDDTSADVTTDMQTTAEIEFVYEFTREYDGYEFNILNAGDIYSMRAEIDREELTGDSLDDAMFNRCRALEDRMGITIVEETHDVDAGLAAHAMQVILAGEDVYDTMYIPARDLYKFTSEGYLNNLLDYDGFNFDQDWWIQSYNDANAIGGELYAAAGYSQLMIIDSIWCLFFNESMMDELKLEYPYDLVRNGTWIIDKMEEYLKAGARLNGDDSFAWDENGSCIYGVSSGGAHYFLRGADERILEAENGKLVFTSGTDRYYNVVSKIVSLLTLEDGHVFQNLYGSDGEPGNYITTFETQRALFLTAELSKTSRMRDKEFSYGIVPFPKYDENQEAYYVSPFYGTPCYTIPVTAANPERSAVIGDALTYLSWDMVLPIFREVTLEQKGLRNDDSIEMLDIIVKSSVPDLTFSYNIGSAMGSEVGKKIDAGDDAVASIIASYKQQIQTQLDKINNK